MFDADGDGDLDLYAGNYAGQQNRLWRNNGSGSFTDISISGDL
jgi:FG-GAP-like repeat